MSAPAFTPGPWRVDKHTTKVSVWADTMPRPHKKSPHPGGVVASTHVCWDSAQMERAEANARLIAAAPGLYADAEFLCARIRELEGSLTDDDEASRQYFGHVLPAVARMESGLAEARGERL